MMAPAHPLPLPSRTGAFAVRTCRGRRGASPRTLHPGEAPGAPAQPPNGSRRGGLWHYHGATSGRTDRVGRPGLRWAGEGASSGLLPGQGPARGPERDERLGRAPPHGLGRAVTSAVRGCSSATSSTRSRPGWTPGRRTTRSCSSPGPSPVPASRRVRASWSAARAPRPARSSTRTSEGRSAPSSSSRATTRSS